MIDPFNPGKASGHIRDTGLLLRFANWLSDQVEEQKLGRYTSGDLNDLSFAATILRNASVRLKDRIGEEQALRDGSRLIAQAELSAAADPVATPAECELCHGTGHYLQGGFTIDCQCKKSAEKSADERKNNDVI